MGFSYSWVDCDFNYLYGLGTGPDDICGHDSKSKEINLSESVVEANTESHERKQSTTSSYTQLGMFM